MGTSLIRPAGLNGENTVPVELHNFILQSMKHNSSGLVTEKCEHDDPFHNCLRVKDDGTLGNNIQ